MNHINSKKIEEHLSIERYAKNLHPVATTSKEKRLEYYKTQARLVGADYVYFLKNELENKEVPFVYIYDERNKTDEEKRPLYKINKQIWTLGEIVLAIVVYDDEIKIIDTRQPISKKKEASFWIEEITEIDKKLRVDIFEGRILEQAKKNYAKNSPYQKLLDHIEQNILKKEKEIGCGSELLKKLLVKFILIKYLEEQTDNNGNSVFSKNYFKQFIDSPKAEQANFCDVLRAGDSIVGLLKSLSKQLNGGIFEVNAEEIKAIQGANLDLVANALDGDKEVTNQISIWRLYDFKLLPIEFISRLYERFVVSVEGKQKKEGAYYTPPHLARLLIDELLPFDKEINFNTFKLLDPSCGSGVFLVLAYKRLISIWLLREGKQKIEGIEDIKAIKKILANCIYGLDINADALSITATSLQIELTSHIQPKEIWESLKFDDLQKKGNLKGGIGFFKWYKKEKKRYDVIVGNPPFKVDNTGNVKSKLDDDIDLERFETEEGLIKKIPQNNPASAMLYLSLSFLLKLDGSLFFIMPAGPVLYNPTAVEYRNTIFSKWEVEKVYDFTPLRNNLWRKAKVATVALLIRSNSISLATQHIVIRNSVANENGAIRFEVDKYDKYKVSINDILTKDYIWKANLLGGGRIPFYIAKYKDKDSFIEIEDFLKQKKKSNGWIYQEGAGSSFKKGKEIESLGLPLLKNEEIKNDKFVDTALNLSPTGRYQFYNENTFIPPFLIVKKNIEQGLPVLFNNEKPYIFDNTFFGIKCPKEDSEILETFGQVFKENRLIYKFLITATAAKTFIQMSGNSFTNSHDIKRLPLKLNEDKVPVIFDEISLMEQAVIEDTELMAECVQKTTGKLFEPVIYDELIQYGNAFCEVINFVYQNGDYKFRMVRSIIQDGFVWVTFEHTNQKQIIGQELLEVDNELFTQILEDDISNDGLRINRIITYYEEKNRISFIKPIRLKFWTRSIAYRDAENVKADMFKNGY
ncbi:MAG: Unknown protein [uncultured Aureispira sp.]|uniref:site-specific DNA-methyltransferase (adenine-specific) n=1 Tax=uncultured Aureispira sp. TaxID=1331704 RepID=A0A6S6UN28_9BACT|nr:MAG: Unknown protein [uncultured Aureispira sp.]